MKTITIVKKHEKFLNFGNFADSCRSRGKMTRPEDAGPVREEEAGGVPGEDALHHHPPHHSLFRELPSVKYDCLEENITSFTELVLSLSASLASHASPL